MLTIEYRKHDIENQNTNKKIKYQKKVFKVVKYFSILSVVSGR